MNVVLNQQSAAVFTGQMRFSPQQMDALAQVLMLPVLTLLGAPESSGSWNSGNC